jgi:gas vesicle protein
MQRSSQTPRRGQQWMISKDEHRRETAICGTLSLITGAAIGAAMMWAFDPESGEKRRHAAYESASGAIDSAGHALGDAYHSAAGSVGHALSHAGDYISQGASNAAASLPSASDVVDSGRRFFNRANRSAADTAADYRDRASHQAHSWLDSARGWVPEFRRPTDVSMTSASAVAVSAIACGVGAMWLFDPARGRGRRAWLGQKATRAVNETGRFMRATGRHFRNKAKGYYHETSGYVGDVANSVSDSQLVESVRSAIGRAGDFASSITVTAQNGRVRLCGQCISDQVMRVLDLVRGTPGVRGIDNSLEVSSSNVSQSSASA